MVTFTGETWESKDAKRSTSPRGNRAITITLYVSPTDSEELRAQLAFRVRLRESRELAIEYEALKRELAARFRDDRMGYTDAKTDFVAAASRPLKTVDAPEQESKPIASPAQQPESRGGEMHVRVARFEGIDVASIDRDIEQFRRMVRSEERPEWMPEETFETLRDGVRRVMSLVDRDAGVSIDLTFTDNAEDAKRVHEALDSLSPPDTAGRRASVQTLELMLDEQL
ncbi:MAG: GrpB family protein [Actinobacteria bacterium]|nr:GrpB family protein [Actinomycetota bacterium]